MGEIEVERRLGAMAAKNLSAGSAPFFLGGGAYRHHVPAAVDHLIQRGEFLTSYTPYQPEIAQGTLQYLFEFQTQVALLTGMEVANASLYDGATACAEAVDDGRPGHRPQQGRAVGRAASALRAVCETYARFAGIRDRGAGPRAGRRRGPRRAGRPRHVLRRRAEPRFLSARSAITPALARGLPSRPARCWSSS